MTKFRQVSTMQFLYSHRIQLYIRKKVCLGLYKADVFNVVYVYANSFALDMRGA